MTNQSVLLKAEARTMTGRKVKQLRREGIAPANIFGKKIKSQSIQINVKEFLKVYQEAGETSLINLSLSGQTEKPVLVSSIQIHPVSGVLLHVDFHQVDLKEKVTATVPVELTGEAPASKQSNMILLQVISEIEVEALPTNIPKSFTADISRLAAIGDSITVKDLNIDSTQVTVTLSPDESVVLIQEQQAETEPETVETVVEGEAETETKDEAETKEGDETKTEPAEKPSETKDSKTADPEPAKT